MEVKALYVYPIKSCRGVSLNTAIVGERGFEFDRQWMIVDEDGKFVTQRVNTTLGLIQPRFVRGGNGVVEALELTLEVPKVAHAGCPALRSIEVPLFTPENINILNPAKVDVRVWRHAGPAFDCGPAAAAWLTALLSPDRKKQYRLVQVSFEKGDERMVNRKHLPGGAPAYRVGFADGYPYLILLEASVKDMNDRARAAGGDKYDPEAHSIDARRFRPNIVVAGNVPPNDDDAWRGVQIGGAEFYCTLACERCVLTTVNPDTLKRDGAAVPSNPIVRMKQYRDFGRGPLFGMNAVSPSVGTSISAGDPIVVTERRSPEDTERGLSGPKDPTGASACARLRGLLVWSALAFGFYTTVLKNPKVSAV